MAMVKCQWCDKKDTDKKQMVNEKKNGVNKYYHHGCHLEFTKEEEERKKDVYWRGELYKYLLDLYDMKIIDSKFILKLNNFRNNPINSFSFKSVEKRMGVDFETILEAYKFSEKDIEYWNDRKSEDWKNDLHKLNYGFTIMSGNINQVYNNKKIEESKIKQEKMVEASRNFEIEDSPSVNIVTKKKKDESCLLDFL